MARQVARIWWYSPWPLCLPRDGRPRGCAGIRLEVVFLSLRIHEVPVSGDSELPRAAVPPVGVERFGVEGKFAQGQVGGFSQMRSALPDCFSLQLRVFGGVHSASFRSSIAVWLSGK